MIQYRPSYVLGIDPGTHTGVAVFNADGSLTELHSLGFWDAVHFIQDLRATDQIALVIEDTRALPVYARNRDRADSAGVIAQKGRGIGVTDAHTALWVSFCEQFHIPYITREPRGAKWGPEILKTVTGWSKRTAQHARDAARIGYRMSDLRTGWIIPKALQDAAKGHTL